MRFARVKVKGEVHYARVEGDWLTLLEGAPWAGGRPTVYRVPLDGAELLAPGVPSKIVCIGQNYRKHAEEMGKPIPAEPLLFLKAPSALNGPGRPIELPPESQEVHHEAELAVVVGATLRRASEAEAAKAIFGFSCFNDVTARDIQRREVQHTRAKSYDTFACLGPWVETEVDAADLRVVCRVNGETRQDGRTSDMVFPPARLLAFISQVMTLHPGDVVSTGTPSGVGRLVAGDRVEVDIERVGVLANPVEGRAA